MHNFGQKGFSPLFIVIFLFITIALGVYLVTTRTNFFPKASPTDTQIFNVKDFGARGDAVTDDTQAVNEAVVRATQSSASKRIVYFPAGNYSIQTINLTNKSNLTLLGVGVATIKGNSDLPALFDLTGARNITIERLFISPFGHWEQNIPYIYYQTLFMLANSTTNKCSDITLNNVTMSLNRYGGGYEKAAIWIYGCSNVMVYHNNITNATTLKGDALVIATKHNVEQLSSQFTPMASGEQLTQNITFLGTELHSYVEQGKANMIIRGAKRLHVLGGPFSQGHHYQMILSHGASFIQVIGATMYSEMGAPGPINHVFLADTETVVGLKIDQAMCGNRSGSIGGVPGASLTNFYYNCSNPHTHNPIFNFGGQFFTLSTGYINASGKPVVAGGGGQIDGSSVTFIP